MFKSKTIWFSIILVVLGALQQLLPTFQDMIKPETYGIIISVIGFVVAYLRTVTTVPLAEK